MADLRLSVLLIKKYFMEKSISGCSHSSYTRVQCAGKNFFWGTAI